MKNWIGDYAGAGRYISKAVGLPLASGVTVEQLGELSTTLSLVEITGDRKARAMDRENLRKRAAMAKRVLSLKTELEREFFDPIFKTHKKFLDTLEGLADYLYVTEKQELEFKKNYSKPFSSLAHNMLVESYRRFFGKEPAFTYSETEGYPGPFWDYVRAVRETSGLNLSEEAIRKAHTRLNQSAKERAKDKR